MPSKLSKLWQELKRRKVIHVIVVYASAAFVIIELVNNVYETLNLPEWTPALTLIILAIGFPLVIIFSWIYERSSEGIKKTNAVDHNNYAVKSPVNKSEPTSQEKSIIVLPFENISSDPEQDYFSDGLTEEIITDLSYINDLLVISRSSAMTFKGTKQTIKEIAAKVNVKYVLEGSVRKSGDNLRIVAQLIDAHTDTHLWAEKYTGKTDDIFDIQEKVSGSIAETLKFKLNPELEGHFKMHPVKSIEAYDYYMKARHDLTSFTEGDLNSALISIQNAIDLVGENPYLISLKGLAHTQYVNMGIKQAEHIHLATELANKALEMDPASGDANFTLGIISMLNGNVKDAVHKLNIALSTDPNNSDYIIWCAWFYMTLGKPSLAKSLLEKVLKIDPLNKNIDNIEGPIACFEGQHEAAAEICTRAYRKQPDNPLMLFFSSLCLAYVGKIEESIAQIDASPLLKDHNGLVQLSRFLKNTLQKDLIGISKVLTKEFVETSKRDGQISFHVACCYSYLGQKEKSIEWLGNAVDRDFINYPLMNEIDPFIENIRGEEGFKKLMQRAKYEWENFEV